jgi:NarL family two-component system response regulator LiaR
MDAMHSLHQTGTLPGPLANGVPPTAASPLAARKLLLVDDHELVRFGVRSLHTEIGGVPIEWVEAGSLQEAIDTYGREGNVDAVLLDLNLPDCKGLQGLRRFLQAHPRARVAVFSATQDDFVVCQARALGASGYVTKSALLTQLRETLATVLWPAGVADTRALAERSSLFPRFPSSAMFDRVAELGPRHLEILELVLSGCANQEICTATGLSLGTVKNYVSSLLLALDVTSRSHLISLFR